MKKLIAVFALGLACMAVNAQVVTQNAIEQAAAKAKTESWASAVYKSLTDKISPLADRHQSDPEWITSRMAMYWEDGKHYTQCYLKNQNWDYGEGNAPVPTVRMPGMRTWNKYTNVPLEQRQPYNKTGDMLGLNRLDPSQPPVLVPYKESGHMIRGNNVEILTLGEEAAFLYRITGDEKYAKFAADIFNQWLAGTFFMNPILDPEQSTQGKGGYEPGGICGYYDYEQIHDDLAMHAATIYDFLKPYLESHPSDLVATTGKSLKDAAGEVFKRFIDIGFVRGGKEGNWNVNGWNMMLLPILVLEDDAYYADGKGKQHYLKYLTDESTQWHNAIPDILKSYDPVTGLWPESPGYSFGTVSTLMDFAQLLRSNGHDIIADNPILQKAALSMLPWIDGRSNMIVFGDSRGGAANFHILEMLLSYYLEKGDSANADKIAAALHKGLENGYDRSKGGWRTLVTYASEIPQVSSSSAERTSYSPFHRLAVMKSEAGRENLMAVLYGGRNGSHLSPNGLALQLYGFGYALAPDAAGYESYWSPDHRYHQSATGSNTIIPGYTHGDVTLRRMEPAVPDGSFTYVNALNPNISFAEMEAGEKRRSVAMIKTDNENGYYVDVFRSNQPDNDYIFHIVGNSVSIKDASGNDLQLTAQDSIPNPQVKEYCFFKNPRKTEYGKDFKAIWEIVPGEMQMDMWMKGADGREIYVVDAPHTTIQQGLTPKNVSVSPEITPTLIVRQDDNNAWRNPFVGVFQPNKGDPAIKEVKFLKSSSDFSGIEVMGKDGRTDLIVMSENPGTRFKSKGISFDGAFCVISEKSGNPFQIYVLDAKTLKFGKFTLNSDENFSASLYQDNGRWYYSSDSPIEAKINGKIYKLKQAYNKEIEL